MPPRAPWPVQNLVNTRRRISMRDALALVVDVSRTPSVVQPSLNHGSAVTRTVPAPWRMAFSTTFVTTWVNLSGSM